MKWGTGKGALPHSVKEDAFQCETENMSAAVALVIKSVEKLAARVAYIMCLVCYVRTSQAAFYTA